MTETIVIYHGGCRDGFCAAWVYNRYWMNSIHDINDTVTYHPGFYGQEPPDVKDKNVIILDFCYQPEVMGQLVVDCKHFIWLDHHKTAAPVADMFIMLTTNGIDSSNWQRKLKFIFDQTRSGAELTWDYFFPNEPRPWLVDYVEDRDLWAKKLVDTDIVNAYIACLEFDFKIWDKISEDSLWDTVGYGEIAIMKQQQYVREVCKNVYLVDILIDKHIDDTLHTWRRIPTVNICQVDCSEVLHELCKKYPEAPFSLYWFKRADGMYQYGMRSIGDFDVSVVAKLFGGGGHRNAAGFQLNYLLEELK